MGRNEFYAWIDQLEQESRAKESTFSWDNADRDPGWQEMRDKRRKYQGR